MATIQGRSNTHRAKGAETTGTKPKGNTRRTLGRAVAATVGVGIAIGTLNTLQSGQEERSADMSNAAFEGASRVLNGTVTLTGEDTNVRKSPVTNNDPDGMDNIAFQVGDKRLVITRPVERTDDAGDTWIGFADPNTDSEAQAPMVWADLSALAAQQRATIEKDAANPDIAVQVVNGQVHNMEQVGQPVLQGVGTAEFVE